VSKSDIFIDAYDGYKGAGVDMSPLAAKLNRKLKKYRQLTKLFACLAFLLFVVLSLVLLFK
jgi:hypothetical protein